MFIIYNLVYLILAIIYLPYFLFRTVKNRKYAEGFFMRFGSLPAEKIDSPIWLHAVSVGEIRGAESLIIALQNEFPAHSLVVSTVTQTGNQMAREILARDKVIYLPFDFSWIVRKVVNKIRPIFFLTFETEIWPNLINYLFKKNVPIALVNGRISLSSFKGYKKVRWLLKIILSRINLFCMQTALDRERIISLGAPPERVKVIGNMKFDQPRLGQFSSSDPEELKSLLKLESGNELFVAGSTHNGEEQIVLEVYRNLNRRFPNLRLLIAPRHPERTPQIERLVARYGFEPARISQLPGYPVYHSPVFILDTIGQLRLIYNLATVVFVGGSLLPRGGHNPIEPAILAKPIIFGPHFFNFQDVSDMLIASKGAVLVKDSLELEETVVKLLSEPSERLALGQRAKEVVNRNLGATNRCIKLIKEKIII
jgi:3-deoxy-D-manno-octulosonic-acid transferase